MSNPRDKRYYDGLNYHGTTYKGDSSIVFSQIPAYGSNHSAQVGLAVALVGDKQAGLGVSGQPLLGKVISVEADLNIAVQDGGYVTLPYPANDTTVPVLGAAVVVNGAGKVIAAGTAPAPSIGIVTTTAGDGTHNEVQRITVANAVGGGFALTFGANTTALLPYNVTAAAMQTALRALASVGGANVTVANPSAGVYDVTFISALGDADQPLISSTNAGLVPALATANNRVVSIDTANLTVDVEIL